MPDLPLGFEKQKTSTMWACGAYSFGHLLNLFGIINYVDKNIKACKTIAHPFTLRFWNGGTNEENIIKALKKLKFKSGFIYEFGSNKAKDRLNKLLKNNKPVILSVDKYGHWMVAAGIHNEKYVIIDSGSRESNTIVLYNWSKLKARWACNCVECDGSKVEWCDECKGYTLCQECFGLGKKLIGSIQFLKRANIVKGQDIVLNVKVTAGLTSVKPVMVQVLAIME